MKASVLIERPDFDRHQVVEINGQRFTVRWPRDVDGREPQRVQFRHTMVGGRVVRVELLSADPPPAEAILVRFDPARLP